MSYDAWQGLSQKALMVALQAEALEYSQYGCYVIRIQLFPGDAPGHADQVANTRFIIHGSILCDFLRRGYT